MTTTALRRGMFAVLAATMLGGILGTATAPQVDAAISSTERQVIKWINADRTARGLRPLREWTALYSIAERRAKIMAETNIMSHTISGNLGSQLTNAGVRWYSKGENIAYTSYPRGLEAAKHIYAMWKRSSIHWAQILSKKFNYVGIGIAYRSSNNRTFAALVFTESPDHTRPIASMTGSNAQQRDITWTWRGADVPLQTHTAGFRDFDVQYRVDTGSWRLIRDNTTATSITLTDRNPGHSYALRVRGRDKAGNVGTWSPELRVTLR